MQRVGPKDFTFYPKKWLWLVTDKEMDISQKKRLDWHEYMLGIVRNFSFFKLEISHGNRMSSMFQMKEDVENEFSERMEQLRDMYKTEIEQLTERLDTERSTAKSLEVNPVTDG